MKNEDKPFKSVQDQTAVLESRGISFADKQIVLCKGWEAKE